MGPHGYSAHRTEPLKKLVTRGFDDQEVDITVGTRLPVGVRAKKNDLLRRVLCNQPLDDFLNHSARLDAFVHRLLALSVVTNALLAGPSHDPGRPRRLL